MAADLDAHPAVVAARRLADEVLAPAAAEVDRTVVPRSHLAALAAAGLLGVGAPADLGGGGAPAPVTRRVQEVLAGADLATWFVQVQHHSGIALAAASPQHADLASDLASGRRLAGIAFSHLRRWPRRPVVAEPDGDGWRLTGTAPWYTGWGLGDVAVVAGLTAGDEVVLGAVDAVEQPGLAASEPMDVVALRAALTVTLDLDGLRLGPAEVLAVEPHAVWAARDARPTRNPVPAVFGVAESALGLLAALGRRRDEPAAVAAAGRIGVRLADVRAEAYHLVDDVDPDEQVDRRLAVRARAHAVMTEATTALVVAGAGASMAITDPAQRKAREAMFLLVQAQTLPSRTVALELM